MLPKSPVMCMLCYMSVVLQSNKNVILIFGYRVWDKSEHSFNHLLCIGYLLVDISSCVLFLMSRLAESDVFSDMIRSIDTKVSSYKVKVMMPVHVSVTLDVSSLK